MASTSHTKADIIKDVRIILDQNETNDVLSTLQDTDQLQTDDIIEKCLKFAIDRVVTVAPIEFLGDWIKVQKYSLYERAKNASGKKGKYVNLVDDFIRIISVFCSDWEQPVYDIHTTYDPEYKLMKSPYGGLRGNTTRPYVFVSNNAYETTNTESGSTRTFRIIEVYTSSSENGALITYIPKISLTDTISIPDLLYQSIIYTTASLYYNTLGNEDMKKMMAEEAAESLLTDKPES